MRCSKVVDLLNVPRLISSDNHASLSEPSAKMRSVLLLKYLDPEAMSEC